MIEEPSACKQFWFIKISHEKRVGDLIRIKKKMCRMGAKNWMTKMMRVWFLEFQIMKGITADESATVHYTPTLGGVVFRCFRYTATMKVSAEVNWEGNHIHQYTDIEDHPEGGDNALNINRNAELNKEIRYMSKKSDANGINNLHTQLNQTRMRLLARWIRICRRSTWLSTFEPIM